MLSRQLYADESRNHEVRIVSVDLQESRRTTPPPSPTRMTILVVSQEMVPIEGVHLVQGDITSQRTVDEVRLLECVASASTCCVVVSSGSSVHPTPPNMPSPSPAAPLPSVCHLPSSQSHPPPQIMAIFREGDERRLADLVVCDGAPDVTGMHDLDEYIQVGWDG